MMEDKTQEAEIRRGGRVKPRLRVIIIPLVALFVACASWYVSIARVPIPVVSVKDVRRGALIASFSATGMIFPKEQRAVQSKIPGTIKKVVVKDGDTVKEGQLLLELESEFQENQILSAETAYLSAKANLNKLTGSASANAIESAKTNVKQSELALSEAERNYKSSKILYDAKAIAREQLEMAKSSLEKAKLAVELSKKQLSFAKTQVSSTEKEAADSQVRQAEMNLQNAQKQIENVKITAPISGKVSFQAQGFLGNSVSASLEEGMMVTQGMALFSIVDTEHLQVKAYVDELQVKDIHPGQQVEIKPESFPARVLMGSVVKVGTQTTQQGGLPTVEVFIDVNDKEGLDLKIGSNVDVNIITQYRSRALIIPQEAIKQEGNRKVVYVVLKTKQSLHVVQKKIIVTGMETSEGVEVLSGLQEGENVVVKGEGTLKDGFKVRMNMNAPEGRDLKIKTNILE